jgi:hypothetical protein
LQLLRQVRSENAGHWQKMGFDQPKHYFIASPCKDAGADFIRRKLFQVENETRYFVPMT